MSSKQDQASVVLVVDDSATDRALAGDLIQQAGYQVAYANDGKEALDQIKTTSPEIVVTDLRMPNLDGLQLVVEARSKFPQIPVVLMTGVGSEEIAAEALRAGAASYVAKRSLSSDLPDVLSQVFDTIRDQEQVTIGPLFRRQESHFELGLDAAELSTVVNTCSRV